MSSTADGKIALVTGAAMGIGAAIAEQLSRDGMTVRISDRDEAAAAGYAWCWEWRRISSRSQAESVSTSGWPR